MSFVVMTNVFDAAIEIDEQYDLKGSTVGRHVTLEDNSDSPEIALKDMNFKHKISLGPERKAQVRSKQTTIGVTNAKLSLLVDGADRTRLQVHGVTWNM